MANVRKGHITDAPQWWKHLRDWKRVFWKGERQAVKEDLKERLDDVEGEEPQPKPEVKIVDTRPTGWSPY